MTSVAGPLLVGYDGSRGATAAISLAAHLLPAGPARVVHLWSSPDRGSALHRRLAHRARTDGHLDTLVAREAAAEAKNVAASGVALAEAAGFTSAEPLVRGVYGGEGLELARLAEQLGAAIVVVGSRGLGGLRALLDSVSDLAVNHSPAPVLVVPPMLAEERAATESGPVLIAHDGSAGAERARRTAAGLLPGRSHVIARVEPPLDRRDEVELPAGAVTLHAHAFGPRATADALAEEAAARGAGVIVVGSRGRSMIREALLGSVARAVLHHAHRPVLVVPSPPT
jgi:nucleotide-binding universal stress UspA family protein